MKHQGYIEPFIPGIFVNIDFPSGGRFEGKFDPGHEEKIKMFFEELIHEPVEETND